MQNVPDSLVGPLLAYDAIMGLISMCAGSVVDGSRDVDIRAVLEEFDRGRSAVWGSSQPGFIRGYGRYGYEAGVDRSGISVDRLVSHGTVPVPCGTAGTIGGSVDGSEQVRGVRNEQESERRNPTNSQLSQEGAIKRGVEANASAGFAGSQPIQGTAAKFEEGASGGVLSQEPKRGKHFERNKRKREVRKAREFAEKEKTKIPEWRQGKKKESVSELRMSLEKKWKAENELAALRAERELAVLQANGVEAEVRRYRTKVCAATERNMVSIEEVHSKLRASGNVSEDSDSRVHTILSEGSGGVPPGTISPNSSVSEAEVRKLQKDYADGQARNKELTDFLKKIGIVPDHLDKYDKKSWTDNTENINILDEMYPDGFVKQAEFRDDGKFCPLVY